MVTPPPNQSLCFRQKVATCSGHAHFLYLGFLVCVPESTSKSLCLNCKSTQIYISSSELIAASFLQISVQFLWISLPILWNFSNTPSAKNSHLSSHSLRALLLLVLNSSNCFWKISFTTNVHFAENIQTKMRSICLSVCFIK